MSEWIEEGEGVWFRKEYHRHPKSCNPRFNHTGFREQVSGDNQVGSCIRQCGVCGAYWLIHYDNTDDSIDMPYDESLGFDLEAARKKARKA